MKLTINGLTNRKLIINDIVIPEIIINGHSVYIDDNVTPASELVSISATKTKTTYEVGEAFSTSDVIVTATYEDSTTANVTAGATIGTVDTSSEGEKTLNISYTEGGITKTTSIAITVSAAAVVLSGITATKTKTTYEVDDPFSTDDVTVTAHYSDGTTADVTSLAVIGTVDTSTTGTKTLSVSYTEDDVTKTDSIEISVVAVPVTLVSIEASIDKAAYVVGDTLDSVSVTATYSDGSTADVTSVATIDTSGVNMSTAGSYTINVSYSEGGITETDSIAITVTAEIPDPVVPQSGTWQYKTTPTTGFIILGKDDDTSDQAMYARMVNGYGYPVTINTTYENAYNTASHTLFSDADTENSLYPSGSVSVFPNGGTVHDFNMVVINNELGEIAQHGSSAHSIWNSDNLTSSDWDAMYSTYTTGGGTKTEEEFIAAFMETYADSDLGQDATYITENRAALKEDLGTPILTLGTWGSSGNFSLDGIDICTRASLTVGTSSVARSLNYWGDGPVTSFNRTRPIDPWHVTRWSGGLSSVQDVHDTCENAYNYFACIEMFAHRFFTGEGTAEQWTLMKNMLDEVKSWVDAGKIQVVTRYQYSQLGEFVTHPISSLSLATTAQQYTEGAMLTDSDFVCKAILDDSSEVTCESDAVLDYSGVDTTTAGSYTATLIYRGHKTTCTVTVVSAAPPEPTQVLTNKSYSGDALTSSVNFCPEALSVVAGRRYHFEFTITLTCTVQEGSSYLNIGAETAKGVEPRRWSENTVRVYTSDGTTTSNVSVDFDSNATRTLGNIFFVANLVRTTITAWSITNLNCWESEIPSSDE